MPIDNSSIKSALKQIKAYTKNKNTAPAPQCELYDSDGLILRLSKRYAGRGKWFVYTKDDNGKRVRKFLGSFDVNAESGSLTIDDAKRIALKGERLRELDSNSYYEFLKSKEIVKNDINEGISLLFLCKEYARVKEKNKRKATIAQYKYYTSTLERLGCDCDVSKLSNDHLRSKLAPLIEDGKIAALNNLLVFLNGVLKYANRSELAQGLNDSYSLSILFPDIEVSSANRPAILDEDIGEFIELCRKHDSPAHIKLFIALVILTACRVNEIVSLSQSFIKHEDLTNMHYILFPDSVMKNKQEYVLPLTPMLNKAVSIFGKIKPSGYSDHEVRLARKILNDWKKYKISLHGFRAFFSSLMHKLDQSNHQIIDMLIAHKYNQSSVSAAYNRYGFYKEKTEIKLKFEDYLRKNTNIEQLLEEIEQAHT